MTDRYAVTIPSAVRTGLDIQPGDKVRWAVTADGSLEVEIVRQWKRGFEDFEPIDVGPTNAAEDHDIVFAGERDESE